MTDWTDYKRTSSIALVILGICLGHPRMAEFDAGSGGELEELDAAYDECVWIRGWKDWE